MFLLSKQCAQGRVFGQDRLVCNQQAGHYNHNSSGSGRASTVHSVTNAMPFSQRKPHPRTTKNTLTLVHHIVGEDHAKRCPKVVLGVIGGRTCECDAGGQRHLCLPMSRAGQPVRCCVVSPSASQPFSLAQHLLAALVLFAVPALPACLPASASPSGQAQNSSPQQHVCAVSVSMPEPPVQ